MYAENIFNHRQLLTFFITSIVLLLAALAGFRPSPFILIFIAAVPIILTFLKQPLLGIFALIPVTIIMPVEFGTGTAVEVNPTILLVPVISGVWLLDMIRRRDLRLTPSRINKPLWLFLISGLISLLLGVVLWDPAVPRPDSFTLVQLAQWSVFIFSAAALWLTGNLIQDEKWLRRLTLFYLLLLGGLVIIFVIPQILPFDALSHIPVLINQISTVALHRSPYWMLLTAVSGGQLLFNHKLLWGQRLFLWLVVGSVLYYVFHLMQNTASNWVGVMTVVGALFWLRWPRFRWSVVILLIILVTTGLLSSTIYDFAGGDNEWEESGGSRLTLISRVIEVTMHNPITGLGPAAYRPYAAMTPLQYGRAFWITPRINSHNNYVDLFSQMGLLGLGLFCWFAVELTRHGFRLRTHFTEGFAAGYVNAMIAAWAGALVLMMFADWILPFVYNIGFPGFQASVLIWLFLGGLVSLEQIAKQETAA